MISDLQVQECFDLLTSTTVGRIGFIRDGRIEILPVNYRVAGEDLLLRTSADGVLRSVADDSAPAAFEVDFHDDLAGTGWSVLMHGRLVEVAHEEPSAPASRVSPWAGTDRMTPLRFTVDSITGRRVRRERH